MAIAKPLKKKELAQLQSEESSQTPSPSQSDINEMRNWVRDSEPTLEQIEQRAQAEAGAR